MVLSRWRRLLELSKFAEPLLSLIALELLLLLCRLEFELAFDVVVAGLYLAWYGYSMVFLHKFSGVSH